MNFTERFPVFVNKILEIYESTVTKPDPAILGDEYLGMLLQNLVKASEIILIFLVWNKTTRSIIALMNLIPPTAKGRKRASRESIATVVNKLIVFQKVGCSF